jgi:hypothetical protein
MWEKTVMSDEEIDKIDYTYNSPYLLTSHEIDLHCKRAIAKAQAEITGDIAIKAGIERGHREAAKLFQNHFQKYHAKEWDSGDIWHWETRCIGDKDWEEIDKQLKEWLPEKG